MPFFTRPNAGTSTPSTSTRRHTRTRRFFGQDRDRVAGGYKAALSNPHTTRGGRKHARHELRLMGRSNETHVPFMTKIRRAFGIRSSPRRRKTTPSTTTTTSRTRRRFRF